MDSELCECERLHIFLWRYSWKSLLQHVPIPLDIFQLETLFLLHFYELFEPFQFTSLATGNIVSPLTLFNKKL